MTEKKNPLLLIIIAVLAIILIYFIFFNVPEEPLEQVFQVNGDEIEGTPYFFEDLPDVEDDFIPSTVWTLNDCDAMEEESKNHCLKAIAVSEGNESICEKIQDIDLKNLCFMDLAYYYERIDLCEKSIEFKSECALDLAIKTMNSSYCEKTNREQEICRQAFQEKNESICYTIGLGRAECVEGIRLNDSNKCNEIDSFKDPCYYYIALETQNHLLCENLSLIELKDACFFRIATEINNINICEKMSEEKENCIIWIAINTNNINLCYQTGTYQQECIEDVRYFNT